MVLGRPSSSSSSSLIVQSLSINNTRLSTSTRHQIKIINIPPSNGARGGGRFRLQRKKSGAQFARNWTSGRDRDRVMIVCSSITSSSRPVDIVHQTNHTTAEDRGRSSSSISVYNFNFIGYELTTSSRRCADDFVAFLKLNKCTAIHLIIMIIHFWEILPRSL